MANGYRFIKDLTSDIMFEATGKDEKEVFENAAKAMFDVICQRDKIGKSETVEIQVKAESLPELMIAWLSELIAEVDIEEMFFSEFEINRISDTHLRAKLYGEEISAEKGETVVKAVTYHNFKFEKTPEGFLTQVVVDI